jgi:transposase
MSLRLTTPVIVAPCGNRQRLPYGGNDEQRTASRDRLQAITLRLAGRSVEEICQIVGRSHDWFHTWWRRYRALGPNGLLELTRANVQPRRIAPDLERAICY